MKKGIICILCTILFFAFTSNVFSANITIDGNIKAYEWSASTLDTFSKTTGDSNCNIKYGYMNYMYVPESRNLYLALCGIESTFNDETLCGVILRINDEEQIELLNNDTASFNTNLYQVEYAWAHPNETDINCEIRIGLKENYYEDIQLEFCLIDSYGAYSNFYTYTLYDPVIETTTSNPKTTKPKTTKPKSTRTTKPKTTKWKTTKSQIAKSNTATQKEPDKEIDEEAVVAFATSIIENAECKETKATEKILVMCAALIVLVGTVAILVVIGKSSKKE